MGKQKLTENKILDLHRSYMNGLSIDEIAAHIGLHRSSILRSFKRFSLPLKDVRTRNSEKMERLRKTNLEKYGVPYVMQNAVVREKFKASEIDYESANEKRRTTCMEKYGVINPVLDPAINNRRKASLRKIDQTSALEKRKETSRNKYGTEHTTQDPEVKRKIKRKIIDRRLSKILPQLTSSGYFLLEDYRGKTFQQQKKHLGYIRYRIRHICGLEFHDDLYLLPRCPQCFPLGVSIAEKSFIEMVKSFGFLVEENVRYLIKNPNTNKPWEVDCYLPDIGIAFEFNGEYSHSTKDKFYHQLKSDLCLSKGIKLFHIWDFFSEGEVRNILKNIFLPPLAGGIIKDVKYPPFLYSEEPFQKALGIFLGDNLLSTAFNNGGTIKCYGRVVDVPVLISILGGKKVLLPRDMFPDWREVPLENFKGSTEPDNFQRRFSAWHSGYWIFQC